MASCVVHKHVSFCSKQGAIVKETGIICAGKRLLKIFPILYDKISSNRGYNRDLQLVSPLNILKIINTINENTFNTDSNTSHSDLESKGISKFFSVYPGYDRSRLPHVLYAVRCIIRNRLFVHNTHYEVCGVGIWPYGSFFVHSEHDSNCIFYCKNQETGELIVRATRNIGPNERLLVHHCSFVRLKKCPLFSLLMSNNISMYIEAYAVCEEKKFEITHPLRMRACWMIGTYLTSLQSRNSSLQYLEELYRAFLLLPPHRKHSLQYARLLYELSHCYYLTPETRDRAFILISESTRLFYILCGKKYSISFRQTTQCISEQLFVETHERIAKSRSQLGSNFENIHELFEIEI